MTNPFGYLIQAQGVTNRQALLDHLMKAKPATLSVLDDFGLCVQIKNLLPNCIVVHRDSNFEPMPDYDSGAFVNYLSNLPDKRIVLMVNCEQGFNADRVALWSRLIATANGVGWRLCVGNVSSGSVKSGQGSDPNEWQTTAAPLVITLAKYPGHYLGFHEYTFPFPWSVSNGAYGDPKTPPAQLDWTLPQWHIGRYVQGVQAACRALAVNTPQCIVTEGFIDTMGDIVEHFGYKADGWQTLSDKWNSWYPGKDHGDVLADMQNWIWEKVYKPCGFVIGMHIYSWGDASGDQHRWENYRVENSTHYLTRVEAYQDGIAQPPPAPTPTPTPPPEFDYGVMQSGTIKITNVSITSINMRRTPDIASGIWQLMVNGDKVQWSTNVNTMGGYRWHKAFHVQSRKTGYVAETGNYQFVPDVVNTPTTPPDNSARRKELIAQIDALWNELKVLE